MNDILENYELRKKDLTFETWFIEVKSFFLSS